MPPVMVGTGASCTQKTREVTMSWGEWLGLGIFILFAISTLVSFVRIFTGPNRVRAFFEVLSRQSLGR